jgi:hypothetical protein
MVELTIKDGKMLYAGQMIRHLRREHQEAFAGVGLNAHRELRSTMAQSSYRRAAFLDGRLAALWGVTGSILSPVGFVWLTLTNEAARHPFMVLRRAKAELDEMMKTRIELTTTVLQDDRAALRLCAFLGFHAEDSGLGAPAYSKKGRKSLMDYVRGNADLRIPVGKSYLISLGFHPTPEFAGRA